MSCSQAIVAWQVGWGLFASTVRRVASGSTACVLGPLRYRYYALCVTAHKDSKDSGVGESAGALDYIVAS